VIIEKPEPMQIGNRYIYSLTSYDPVTVEITKARVTDADVDDAVRAVVEHGGGDPDDFDDAWVDAHIEEASTVAELRKVMREQLNALNDEYAEREKTSACIVELTRRLRQSVPESVVATYRETLQMQFEAELQQQGTTLDQFFAATHSNQRTLDEAFDGQAREAAEESAAIDAYADDRKITVADEEIPDLLGLPADDAEKLVEQAKEVGALDELRRAAVRTRATQAIVAECNCTVHQETEEEAAERVQSYREAEASGDAPESPAAELGVNDDPHKGFKLV
jgi:FKBP-type peptidyl-prolyl cis-trans isomerase (trigger factor)